MISASILLASLILQSNRPEGSSENLNASKSQASVVMPAPTPIPSQGGYTVQEDDNDNTIAKKLGCSVRELHEANPDVDWNRLNPGKKLKSPGTKKNANGKKSEGTAVTSGRKIKFTHDDVILREGPSQDDDVVAKIKAGRTATVVGKKDDWIKVKFDSGTIGWVREDMVGAIAPIKAASLSLAKLDLRHVKVLGKVKFIKGDVIVHTRPSADSDKVSKVEFGREAKAVEFKGGWVKVAFDGGTVGWVREDMVASANGASTKLVATKGKRKTLPRVDAVISPKQDPASTSIEAVVISPAKATLTPAATTAKIVITPPVHLPELAKFVKESVTLRFSASADSGKVSSIEAGRYARIVELKDNWFRVKFEGGTTGWVRRDLVQTASYIEMTADINARAKQPEAEVRKESGANNLIATAKSNLGIRYVWGGTSRSGFDCSGFVGWVFAKHNIHLPRTAIEQSGCGTSVGRSELRTGDLIFFHTGRSSRVNHVGIYLGNNQFIHASSGGGKVRINELAGFYANAYAGARRIAGASRALANVGDSSMVKKVRKGQDFDEHDIEDAARKAEEQPSKVTVGSDAIGN